MPSTTTDDGFHEIQLNGKQLVFLFMAVTVVSVVIFLCGVLVGRGVRPDLASTDPLVAQEVPPPAATAPPPPAAVTSDTGAPATANETLSYPDRLANTPPAREQLRPPGAQPPRTEPAAPTRTAPAGTAPAGRTEPVAPASVAPAAPAPNAPPVRAEPTGPGFAIQLAALRQRDEADGIARRLTAKGYPAYVIAPEAGAPPVFRVRVGKFKERGEAETIAARLQKEEQFNPWIVR